MLAASIEIPLRPSGPVATIWTIFVAVLVFYIVVSGTRSITQSFSERIRPTVFFLFIIGVVMTYSVFSADDIESVQISVDANRATAQAVPPASPGQQGTFSPGASD